jgi:hypothetical protein
VESRSGGTASTLDGGTLKSSGLGFQLHGIYMLPKVLKNCFECCTLDKYLSLEKFYHRQKQNPNGMVLP